MTTFKDVYESAEREHAVEPVPAGTYELEVVAARNVEAKSYIQPTFKIVAGPLAGRKVLAGVLSYTENARSIFFQKLEGFGLGKDFFALGPSADDVAAALVGRVVTVDLDDENRLPVRGVRVASAPAAVRRP